MYNLKSYNLPLFLTLIRLFSVFIILPPLFLALPWQCSFGWAFSVAIIFLALGLTDFIDGWLARVWHMDTVLGRVLDPIADKIFIAAGLIFLSGAGRIDPVIVIVLIAREFLVAGLREAAPQVGTSVPVSWWGKSKMAAQLFLCTFLIVHPGYYGCSCFPIQFFEYVLLTVTVLLSVLSALLYVRDFLRQAGCSIRQTQG